MPLATNEGGNAPDTDLVSRVARAREEHRKLKGGDDVDAEAFERALDQARTLTNGADNER